MRYQKRKRRHLLEVSKQELGSWPQRWNESPLIGIILLLALAPCGDLATKCAAACLMAEGGRDNLNHSNVWQQLTSESSLGDAQKGQIQSALDLSRRWTPLVVCTTFLYAPLSTVLHKLGLGTIAPPVGMKHNCVLLSELSRRKCFTIYTTRWRAKLTFTASASDTLPCLAKRAPSFAGNGPGKRRYE